MAKFIKSIFQSPNVEKRKSTKHEEIEGETDNPNDPSPIGRKLSMSRSGRLKQAYKKRHSLSLELYGNDDIQTIEKPKSKEYHVHSTKHTENHRKSVDITSERKGSKTPEEEIDRAFDVIDKS